MDKHQVSSGMGVISRTPYGEPASWGQRLQAVVEKAFWAWATSLCSLTDGMLKDVWDGTQPISFEPEPLEEGKGRANNM